MNAPTELPASAREHALLSASGHYRWIACPPSARLEEALPATTSTYAEEGKLAHEMAKLELLRYLHRIPAIQYTDAWTGFRADKRVTEDFKAALLRYVQFAISRIEYARSVNRDAIVLVEERVDYSAFVEEGFGTVDLLLLYDGVLESIDLKFGKGRVVKAEQNPQMKLYALGALDRYGFLYGTERVVLTIHQPRIDEDPSSWETTTEDLLAWAEEIAPRAVLAYAGQGDFTPGEHCGYCRANATCRARADANAELVQREFVLPHLLSDDEIAGLLGKLDAVIKWAGDVKAYARRQACAGRKFAGWKLVNGRSNRTYSDEGKVSAALVAAGYDEAIIYQPPAPRKLLGITEMEKTLTKKMFATLLGSLITKPPGALTLVPQNDPREEADQSGGFDEIPTEESDE